MSNIIEAPTELRTTILQILRNEIEPQPHIFDDLQKRVEQIIEKEVYPAFLTSDLFIEYTQSREDGAKAIEAAPEIANVPMHTKRMNSMHSMFINAYDGLPSSLINSPNLQTLHEDSELRLNAKSHSMKPRTARPMPKLTEDLLLATQKGRLEVRPQG